ncbi:hypothetical protein BIW11_04743 [Tropilaelaps mercedesae]|uniref:Uncharacterized protein n=1 Tax=Tropilaelaps mercedesae TaxID=418985 RepID=A0A1V9X1U4_9ACAR|nr:hypothetical protein BIW11_04743 [Tropilaelaps mercedesae]
MDRIRRIIRRGMIDAVPFYGLMARRRLLALCIILTMLFLLYSGPSMFRFVRRKAPFMMDASLNSMLIHLEDFEKESASFDAQLQRSYDSDDVPFTPFVGNGYIAYNEANDHLLLFSELGRLLQTALPFSPVVRVSVDNKSNTGHVFRILQFVRGMLTKVETQKLTLTRNTITVRHDILTHRNDPSVFLQGVSLSNDGKSDSVDVKLHQRLDKLDPSVHTRNLRLHDRVEYVQLSGKLPVGQKFIVYSVIVPKLADSVTVDAKTAYTLELLSIVKYSKPVGAAEVTGTESKMNELSKADLDRVLLKDMKLIKTEHTNAWQDIWRSGVSISLSRAENALNGDRINATLYYVLSHTPKSSAAQPNLPALGKHCYKGHHTLSARTLWPSLADLGKASVLERTMQLWQLTLFKRGCGDLLSHGGPHGAMQAMLMSFGAFFFHEGHLEFSTLPADLHRDFHYRRLMLFTPGSRLNVSVTVNPENKALLAVSAEAEEQVYACDGGCLDPPVPISNLAKPVVFPVKQTDPPTAVLYVARNQRHLSELKHTLHVHEVAEAPAHEKHVIALHKHGHQLGGLPALFWATFAFLVVLFHLFLARIIYNEYFAKGQYAPLDTNNKKYVA